MLVILVYYLILIPFFYSVGFVANIVISKLLKTEVNTALFLNSLIGMAILSSISNWISLVNPIGTSPFPLLLIAISALSTTYFLFKKNNFKILIAKNINLWSGILFILILGIVLLKSASPSEILDEGGYYLPYIKWIEEFGIVPGLANLQGRFGFNSSWHTLSALLSLRWSGIGPLYDLNGILTLFYVGFLLFEIPIKSVFYRYIGLFLSVFVFRNFLTSSAADLSSIYFSILTILIFIVFIDLKEKNGRNYYLLIAFVFCCLAITIKTSNIIILIILVSLLLVEIIKTKNYNILSLIISVGLFFAIPWIIRFYLLTGYIVFPFAGLDIFNPDWKVPLEVVKGEAIAVKTFAMSDQLRPEILLNMSISEWFPIWFKSLYINQKIFFIAILMIISFYILTIKIHIKENQRFLIIIGLISYLFIWFFAFPDFRFAWGIILILTYIGIYDMSTRIKFKYFTIFFLFISIGMITSSVLKTLKDSRSLIGRIYLLPSDIPVSKFPIEKVKINNFTAYQGSPPWDAPLPSVLNWQRLNIELRGDNLSTGFRILEKN